VLTARRVREPPWIWRCAHSIWHNESSQRDLRGSVLLRVRKRDDPPARSPLLFSSSPHSPAVTPEVSMDESHLAMGAVLDVFKLKPLSWRCTRACRPCRRGFLHSCHLLDCDGQGRGPAACGSKNVLPSSQAEVWRRRRPLITKSVISTRVHALMHTHI
jgi:hypothetical protein